MIERKTAKLFEAAAQLGAVLGGADAAREDAFRRYGMHLGTAFQIMDDVLDYEGDAAMIGKNLGDDLGEGKMTLPLIRALAVEGPPDSGGDPPRDRRRRPDRLRAGDGGIGTDRRPRLRPRARGGGREGRRRTASTASAVARRPDFATIDGFRGRSAVLADLLPSRSPRSSASGCSLAW